MESFVVSETLQMPHLLHHLNQLKEMNIGGIAMQGFERSGMATRSFESARIALHGFEKERKLSAVKMWRVSSKHS